MIASTGVFPSFLHHLNGKFDNQDGVLGGKPDGGQQTNLEVNVIT